MLDMAEAREAVRAAYAVRLDIQAVEKIVATRNDPELSTAVEKLHATLQAAWIMTRDHFNLPAPRSGGEDKPER